MTDTDWVNNIVDIFEEHAKRRLEEYPEVNLTTHLFAISRMIDMEVGRRMESINERNRNVGTIFVGHCGCDNSDIKIE